jgi:RNA polymerase sigma-70 factor (ECF subfamily)
MTIENDDELNVLENRLRADEYFDENTALVELQKAINLLPEKQKIVFNMRYYDEMPYAEISKILETSVGALKASYHHAVKKIENYLMSKDFYAG